MLLHQCLSVVSMSDSKKMKFVPLISLLFIVIQLIELTVGSCQLRATVRTRDGMDSSIQDSVSQTQLQLLCENAHCPVTNFTACDISGNIFPDCSNREEGCSRLFNLCENSCICTESQESTTPPTQQKPNTQGTTELTPINDSNNISCTPVNTTITITVSTVTVKQSSCNTAANIITPTIATQEATTTIALTTATTTTTKTLTTCPQRYTDFPATSTATWTPYPQNTTELVTTTVTKEPFKANNACKPIISIRFIATTVASTVYLLCTPSPSQFTIPSVKSNSITTSPPLEAGPCIQPDVPAQGSGSSITTSALGGLLGLSLVLLALVTTGWVWTCWIVSKRGRFTINLKQSNFPNTPGTVTINNNTDTLRRLQNPLYEETTTNGLLTLSEAELQTGQGESEETGPTYEIIPLADPVNTKASKKNGNARLEEEETPIAGGWVSVGEGSPKNDNTTQDNIGSVDGGNVNHYYLPDEKAKGESSKRTGERNHDNNYHLLGNAEEEREEVVRESFYHVLENPLDSYDEDYADPDVEEMNNIYHVLEGPTPEEEEEKEGQTEAEREEVEKEKVEREEERDREKFEPTAYEVPLTSGSKHNNTVLQ